MLMDAGCRTRSKGMHISYSRACCTGLQDTVHTQLLHILPDHINTTGLNRHSLFRACSGFCVLCFLSHAICYRLYSSELHLTIEWTLAIHRFNTCGCDDSQETHKVHSLGCSHVEACVCIPCP